MTSHGNPEQINKVCEWTSRHFVVDWKHRHQRFIDRAAMYAWRKNLNREFVKCLNCEGSFERYKRILHVSTGRLTEYCSDKCRHESPIAREKKKKWTTENNPMRNPLSVDKIKKTKLERYGCETYNNLEKCRKTCFDKYGVECSFDIPSAIKSNGKRISKFQRGYFEKIKILHQDALLEHYLKDVRIAVDIFIPSLMKVIECYGDYWHCNPVKYKSDYYNKSTKLTSIETWKRDSVRIDKLKRGGYEVDIVWENNKLK